MDIARSRESTVHSPQSTASKTMRILDFRFWILDSGVIENPKSKIQNILKRSLVSWRW